MRFPHRFFYRIAFMVLACSAINRGEAQLVFVPDVQLRIYLDSVSPGIIDANGYIDSGSPQAVAMQQLSIVVTWTPLDLTGIEALTNLQELHVLHEETGVAIPLTMSSFPTGLLQLEITNDFIIAALPPFPVTLQGLQLVEFYGLTTLPALPPGLMDLSLLQMMDLTSVPPLPPVMHSLGLLECPELSILPTLPTQVFILSITALPVTELPTLPVLVTAELHLKYLHNLISLPEMPQKVQYALNLWSLPLIDSIPQLPDSCPELYLVSMPSDFIIGMWPVNLAELHIHDGGPACLPLLPATLTSMDCIYCGLQCLPNMPPNIPGIYWNDVDLLPNEYPICNLLSGGCAPAACGIGGTVFIDADVDGVFDPGEQPYAGAAVQATPGNWLTSTLPNGNYVLGVQPDTYDISCSVGYPYVQSIMPASHSASFTQLSEVDTLNNFAVVLQPNVQDLIVDLSWVFPPVPGFTSQYFITCHNYGTQVQDGTIAFTHDPLLPYMSSSVPPTSTAGNVLSWNIAQMQPGEVRTISIILDTPVGTALGTPIIHTVYADPIATDETPADNSAILNLAVVGAYDPNDKAVEPSILAPAQVLASDRVNYTVRFQNTGSYPASRVIITDTLSVDLQWNSIQITAASHAYTWFMQDGVLGVIFDNIMLPDSTSDEVDSHGFFKFSIVPQPSLVLGDVVTNRANIYFDYNEPVITNEALVTIDVGASVQPAAATSTLLYPNPVIGTLTIEADPLSRKGPVEIMDALGRVLLSKDMDRSPASLDVSLIPSGTYGVRLAGMVIGRFVKL